MSKYADKIWDDGMGHTAVDWIILAAGIAMLTMGVLGVTGTLSGNDVAGSAAMAEFSVTGV